MPPAPAGDAPPPPGEGVGAYTCVPLGPVCPYAFPPPPLVTAAPVIEFATPHPPVPALLLTPDGPGTPTAPAPPPPPAELLNEAIF